MQRLTLPPAVVGLAAAPLGVVAACVVAAAAMAALGSGHDFGGIVPQRQLAPWPLVPAIAAALFGVGIEGRAAWLERTSARGPLGPRAARLAAMWALAGLGLLLTQVLAGGQAEAEIEAVGGRNLLLIGGLALLCASLLPELVALLLPMGYLAVCIAAGQAQGGAAAPWALPLQPVGDAAVTVMAWALAVTGTLVALVRGSAHHA